MPYLLEFDVAIRLLLASLLGAAIGFEREVHGHPAGMRTHLLVALGSALFSVLSIYGFEHLAPEANVDTSRVAAQIVSGIGFLGAGAILKEGLSIRGLTTAASLWATAAVGMAAGTGWAVVAVFAMAIIIFSLWPLNRVADRIHGIQKQLSRVRIGIERLEALAQVTGILTRNRLEIIGIQTERIRKGRYEVEIDVRIRPASDVVAALQAIERLEGVEIMTSGTPE